jgi:hypothetical protein
MIMYMNWQWYTSVNGCGCKGDIVHLHGTSGAEPSVTSLILVRTSSPTLTKVSGSQGNWVRLVFGKIGAERHFYR